VRRRTVAADPADAADDEEGQLALAITGVEDRAFGADQLVHIEPRAH
jgi:hypothetical protein